MNATGILSQTFDMTVDGRAESATEGFDVINPSTMQVIARAPECPPSTLNAAMRSAQAAFPSWSRNDAQRQATLVAAAAAIENSAERLSVVLTAEQGKPLAAARSEIGSAVRWLRYFASIEPSPGAVERIGDNAEVTRKPLGVVVAITPWNFPIALATWKIGPALRAGNTLVLKPSPFTPLTTLLLGQILAEVFPPGVLNVISGREPLGSQMCTHPIPRMISFTGSTETGKGVARAAGDDLKRLTLELGGNDPAIVLEDADVEGVADKLFWAAFVNNGQACLAVKRTYAHRKVHDDLIDAMAERARAVSVGDGFAAGVQLGPINNRSQFDRVADLVSAARRRGARVHAGGDALDTAGYFYAPTVLSGVTDADAVAAEEQFGPVMPVLVFDEVDEVVARANSGRFGLTASVWSEDAERAAAIATLLDVGQVSINSHASGARPDLPFGGRKWSGIGVENGRWGLDSFTETLVITR